MTAPGFASLRERVADWFPVMLPREDVLRQLRIDQDSGALLVALVVAVPMAAVETHAAQCQKNHGQSPKRLRERGGLSAAELCAVLADRPYRHMQLADANAALLAALDAWP